MAESAETIAQLRQEIEHLTVRLGLLGSALDNMTSGLCMFDAQGRVMLSNPRYAEVVGLPPEKIRPGMTCAEQIALGMEAGLYPLEMSAQELERRMWANLNGENETRQPFKSGARMFSVHPQRTAEGHVVATFIDITARTKAEKSVSSSEARLATMMEAMPDCIKIFDECGRLIHINPQGLELLKAPNLEALFSPDYAPVPPEYLERSVEVHRQVIAGEAVNWIYELIDMQGRRFQVEAHAVPFRLPDGSRAQMSISRDISVRQEAENALRRNEARLRLVQEATGLVDFEAGPNGIAICSERFVEQTGLPPGTTSLPFEEWLEIVHPEDRKILIAEIEQSLLGKDFSQCEFRIVRPDTGETRWILSKGMNERDEDGNVTRTIGAHLDITDRKRSDEASVSYTHLTLPTNREV